MTIAAGAMGGRQSFEIYREAVSAVFDAEIADWSQSPDFSVQVHCIQLGPMLLARAGMFNADYRYDRNRRKAAQAGSDVLLVQIILEGSDTRYVKDRFIVSQPGDVFLCDLTRTLTTQTRNCRNFTFALPHGLFGLSDPHLDGIHDVYFPANSLPAKLLRAHVATLWDNRDHIDPKDAEHYASSTAGLIAGLTNADADSRARHEEIATAELKRVQRFIEANLLDPDLGPEHICSKLGLSRSALYRLMEAVEGVTNYIRERRMRRVFQEIVDGRQQHKKISQLAYQHGFVNASAFARTFKSIYGATPSDIRAMAAQAPFYLGGSDGPLHDGERLRHWLNLLGRI
ncbi:AraC family transcriptional regulator [Rhizobium sp. LjRoot30]|uniref:AraC family transcriptional regulator n=1 Tax=Rhizobium sp. LjRoot30 TaxID=3342320 RepID=UPI003ECD491A